MTRNDSHSWTEAGLAIGQQVNLPWTATLGSFTITGFAGRMARPCCCARAACSAPRCWAWQRPSARYRSTTPPHRRPATSESAATTSSSLDGPGVGAGSPGPSSPLAIFGDTSQDGIWYSSDPSQQSGHLFGPKPTIEPVGNAAKYVFPLAQPFQYSGNDFLDASALDAGLASADLPSVGVTVYGGRRRRRDLRQPGRRLPGRRIGRRPDPRRPRHDQIYGDSGINVDVLTRNLAHRRRA